MLAWSEVIKLSRAELKAVHDTSSRLPRLSCCRARRERVLGILTRSAQRTGWSLSLGKARWESPVC